MPKRVLLVWISLLAAILACTRSQAPVAPATPQVSTPVILTLRATETARPSATATRTPSATRPPTETDVLPTSTSVIQPPPTETPTITLTPPASETPTRMPPATATTRGQATATAATGGAARTPTPSSAASGPQPIPENATFTQIFIITYEGTQLVGRPVDMTDKRTDTWASLRDGNTAWILKLSQAQTLVGVRLYAQKDGTDPTTLTRIEVSADGSHWTTVLVGSGDCGVPRCETLPQRQFTALGFGPVEAQYVRLTSGPTRFAFAEIEVAVLP